jgi:hypothetical protein
MVCMQSGRHSGDTAKNVLGSRSAAALPAASSRLLWQPTWAVMAAEKVEEEAMATASHRAPEAAEGEGGWVAMAAWAAWAASTGAAAA